jgi:DNA/RNA endonuclease YhcR with UshA esterase domain
MWMKNAWLVAMAVVVAVGATQVHAADEAPAAPASQPSSAPSIVQASDADAVKAAVNTETTVEGVIKSAEWSSSGKVMNAQFKDSDLRAAAFSRIKEKLDKAFSGDVAKTLTGAKVRIKGKLQEFKGHPEILINDTTQITILEPGDSAGPSSK